MASNGTSQLVTAGRSSSVLRRASISVAAYVVMLVALILVGRNVTPPDHEQALTPGGGALAAAVHVLTGQGGGTDILLDYASADALANGLDPYETMSVLAERVGTPWPVSHANPHPPTVFGLLLPFTLLPYEAALSAWSLAMVGVLIATMRLVGVRMIWASLAALAIAVTWPGAYGIGNVVPLIGLGVAGAWRWRDSPAAAGAFIALAAAPKISGLLLFIPLILTRRFRAVLWGLGFMVALSGLPVLFVEDVWAKYLGAGLAAIEVTAARGDNASLLELGIPSPLMLAGLVSAALLLAVRTRDIYWPTVWLMVAALPIAWMYSLLTLLPALIRCLPDSRSRGFVVAGAAVAVGSSPSGEWPTVAFPVVVILSYVALSQARGGTGFPPPNIRGLDASGFQEKRGQASQTPRRGSASWIDLASDTL